MEKCFHPVSGEKCYLISTNEKRLFDCLISESSDKLFHSPEKSGVKDE